jgi:hypothetical protein
MGLGVQEWPLRKVVQSISRLDSFVMSSPIFNSSENLRGQSFAHALAPFDRVATDSDEFVESGRMSVFVDEQGTVNVADELRLFKDTDPIDAEVKPKFSPGNKFIQGLLDVVSAVPVGGIILYTKFGNFGAPTSAPGGYGLCDGSIYKTADGGTFVAPNLGTFGTATWIVKLPAGVKSTGDKASPLL